MKDVAEAIFSVQSCLFKESHSLEEIRFAVDNSTNSMYFPQVKDSKEIILQVIPGMFDYPNLIAIIDERDVTLPSTNDYENRNITEQEFFKSMSNYFNQEEMLLRSSYTGAKSNYADYTRVEQLFKSIVCNVLSNMKDGIVLVLAKTNASYGEGYYASLVLSILNNNQVYILTNFGGSYSIAKQSQLWLYKLLQNAQDHDNMPYFLRIAQNQIYKEGRHILLRYFGRKGDTFHRILTCDIQKTSIELSSIKIYSLEDLDKFIQLDYEQDEYSMKPYFTVSVKQEALDVKIKTADVNYLTGFGGVDLLAIDPVESLVGAGTLCRKHLDTVVHKLLEQKYVSTKASHVEINGNSYQFNKATIEETVLKEYLQQYCNILSSQRGYQPVFVQNVVGFKINGKTYISVESRTPRDVKRDIRVRFSVGFDKEPVEKEFDIFYDNTQLVKANAPLFTDIPYEQFQGYDSYSRSIIVKCLYSYLTKYSKHRQRHKNIPVLAKYLEQGDDTFMEEHESVYDLGSNIKRIVLSNTANERIQNLVLKDYNIIPRSYKDSYIDCLGNIDSGRQPDESGPADNKQLIVYV